MNLNNGYIEIYMPQHPNARSNGTILEHRFVAEGKLGRYLKKEETVHHLDENRTNNNPDNLIVFRTNSDHSRFHKIGIMKEMDDGTYICPIKESEIKKCKHCGGYYVYNREHKNKKFCSFECYIEYENYKFEEKVISGIIPNKEKLNELIHNISFVEIGNIYNVSDNTVRKWCKKYGLPYKYKEIHIGKYQEVKCKRTLYDCTHKVKMHNECINLIFNSLDDAVLYLVDNKITKDNIRLKGIRDSISNAHRNKSKYYNYYWTIM